MSEPIHSTDPSPGSGNDASTPARQWPPTRRSFAPTPENNAAELAAVEQQPTPPTQVVTKESYTNTTFEKVKATAEAMLLKPNAEAIGDHAPGTLRATVARVDGGRERFRVFITWEPNA